VPTHESTTSNQKTVEPSEKQRSVETPSAPQTHIVESGEIVMSGKSELAVGTDRYVPTKNNTDIGKGAVVRKLVREKAREMLQAGWRKRGKNKAELNIYLSDWLKNRHHQLPGDPLPADNLHLDPHEIGRAITDVWQEFHPNDDIAE
jgi:hypothetical protein